jgi:hypothetical protein
MKKLAVATLEAKPLVKQLATKRLKTVPKRITGLYRFSIVSKTPFEVNIGGRVIEQVRTLDVFHEAPMFIDQIEHVAAVDLLNQGRATRKVRLHPTPGRKPAQFRISAHEIMPEREEFERKKMLGSVETPLRYEGLVKHLIETARTDEDVIIEPHTAANRAADAVAGAIALTLQLGALMVLAAGAHATFSSIALAGAVVACDPSRTYINGALYKNLQEVRVKIGEGQLLGYTYP